MTLAVPHVFQTEWRFGRQPLMGLSTSNKLHSPHPHMGNCMQWWRPALALLIIALVYFYRIDQPPLWGDEADTGIEARNILRRGYPVAYDGRNVSIFEDGSQLNGNLVCNKIPWIQYYLGALSLLIFGNNTPGLRVLFAFSGVLSFFPIYAILRSRLKYPAVLTVLTLVAPQVVLFQRNARYYPLLILFYAVLLWHVSGNFKSSRNHFVSASLIFVLLFHTHSFAALCSAFSLIAFCLLFRREVLASYFFACGAGFASWFLWHRLLGPPLAETPLPISLITTHFSLWLGTVWTGLLITIVDMDAVGCFPILLWTGLLAFLLLRSRNALRNLFREQLYAFVFLNILIQAVAGAAFFGCETGNKYSLLRYAPHLLVFGLVCLFMVLNAAIAGRNLCLFASVFAVAFNLLTMSFWAKPLSRRVPASWLLPVYSEIFRPRENAWDPVIARLESESKNAPGRDLSMISLPAWTQEVAIFYLGGRYFIRPLLQKPTAKCVQALHEIMDEQAFDSLSDQPDWILDFLDVLQTVPAGYGLAVVIPSHQTRPDDGNRPELTRHAFPQSAVVSDVRLFRLRKQ
jgi:hypothetical protein